MADSGLTVRPERVEQGHFSFRSGFEAAGRLLSGEDRPTAIFASNDDMALGVMAVANRLRLNVPETLSIAGFDDTPGAKITWPQLTTVRQPIAAMAGAAADMLLTGVAWEEGEAPPSQLLDFELVVRESTGPAPV
jgi:LacI family transcriptional regulator